MKKDNKDNKEAVTIELLTGKLKNMLKALAPFVGKRDELAAVMITAAPSSNTLRLGVTEGTRAAEGIVAPENVIRSRVAVCVSFPALAGFVGVEDSAADDFDNEDEKIVLELDAESGLTLCGVGAACRRRMRLATREVGLFIPGFERDAAGATLEFRRADEFADAFGEAAARACPNADRFILHGVHLRCADDAGKAALEASDGFSAVRLGAELYAESSNVPAGGVDAVFPLDGANALLKAMKTPLKHSRLTLNFRATTRSAVLEFALRGGGFVRVLIPVAEQKFPDLSPLFAVFSEDGKDGNDDRNVSVSIDADALRGVLAQVVKTTGSGAEAMLDFSEIAQADAAGDMAVSAYGSVAYTASVPATRLSATTFPAGVEQSKFSAKRLAQALDLFAGGRVRLRFSSSARDRVCIVPSVAPVVELRAVILMGCK